MRTISTFFNAGYSYKAKYNIEGSYKIAQGTAFGINARLAKNKYWALGGSWNINKENFMKDIEWINSLKLRGSYGVNGNMRRGLTTQTTIYYSNKNWVTGRTFANIASSANPNLAPEKTTSKSIGVDFGFFNRLMGSIDVYERFSEDLLVTDQVNDTYGLGNVMINAGEISNKGIELSLQGDVLKKKDFSWRAILNLSYNKNEVLKYGKRVPTSASSYYRYVKNGETKVIGKEYSVRAFYDWAGLDDNGNPMVYNKDGEKISYADEEFVNLTQDDMVISKPFDAPYYGGLSNVLTYKNWTLSSLMTFEFGHVFTENLETKYATYSPSSDITAHHKDIANAWTPDNTNTYIPALPADAAAYSSYDRRYAFIYSNAGIQDAAHIRLKDITLNYRLKKGALDKVGIKNASFNFQVRNLGIIWAANDKNIDPQSVPFSGRAMNFGQNFRSSYRPGIKVPVSFVIGAKFEF
jgi:hypothetical protein